MSYIEKHEERIATAIAQMAHEANLIWGAAYKCAVDARDWYKLTDQERQKKINLILQYGDQEDSVTCEEQHKNWLLTAPKDHPCNKPYADLTFEQRAKDSIFAAHIKLYKELKD